MTIGLFILTGSDFPGGCEKYFSILANHFSSKNKVYFIQSEQYVSLMERFYHIMVGHKVGTIDWVKRDIGKGVRINLQFSVLLPFSKENRKIKSILDSSDFIYSKNEFQELLLLYLFLGKKDYCEKVIVGVHTPIFVSQATNGLWKMIHNMQYNSFFYRMFLKNCKLIHVVNSDYIKLINNYYKIDKKKIIWIPNPIEWETNYSDATSSKFNIVWLGRLSKQKGIDRLSSIIEILSKKKYFTDLNFLIGGEGEEKREIEKLAKKYKNVTYLGFVKNIESVYKKSDISIFTAYFDTFAHAVLEPQSFGVPVVSYDMSGPNDIVINNKTGYLVNTENEFAEAIIKLYLKKSASIKEFNSFRKEIFKLINKKFSKGLIFKRLEFLFK